MRIDIENKILLPFMILLIVSIFTIAIVSFVNGYNLLLKNDINNSSHNLEEMVLFIEKTNVDMEDEDEAKAFVIDYYKDLGKDNLIIFNSDEILLNTNTQDNKFIGNLMNEVLDNGPKSISEGNYIFTYQRYEKWNWVISYCLNRDNLLNDVLDSQKYIILIAIIALIFSMQASIFIAYNISKPIKMLAELCDKIVVHGSYKEKIGIIRNDEIGTLANAFNNMLDTVQNNTDRLIEATKFNEDILKNISAGIITADQRGQILSINQAANNFLSSESEKINRVRENMHDQIKETLNTNMKINKILAFDDVNGGNKKYIDVTTSLLIGEEGSISGAICNFYDITERKRIENSMGTLDRLTSVGQFAAGIAHEVRNPLAGMKTSIQVLQNRLCKGDKEENVSNKKLFNGVLLEIDRINYLITGLLNFARPRLPNCEKTDLLEVLDRSLDLIEKTVKENNIEINIENNSGNAMAFVDKAQIEQIFINIIKNALNAMGKEGILNIILNNCSEEKGKFIEIVFHDNGCGIQPQDLVKVFNPFFTTSAQGTGLGLSVVYELVKGNQGEIDIQSVVNEGTKVKIKFPINGGNGNENKNIDC